MTDDDKMTVTEVRCANGCGATRTMGGRWEGRWTCAECAKED